jgi:hypothetical protein
MAEFDFSIPNLFQRAFGIGRGKAYDGSKIDTDSGTVPKFENFEDSTQEGTEFLTVRNQLNARLADGRALFMPVRIGGVLLPNEPTVMLTRRKRIQETSLVGSKRRGTVKELISIEDWQITIRGICVNAKSALYYPEDQVKSIIDLDGREEALDIECALMSLAGIYRVVIRESSFPEMIGIQHAQAYELKCVSDEDFILQID